MNTQANAPSSALLARGEVAPSDSIDGEIADEIRKLDELIASLGSLQHDGLQDTLLAARDAMSAALGTRNEAEKHKLMKFALTEYKIAGATLPVIRAIRERDAASTASAVKDGSHAIAAMQTELVGLAGSIRELVSQKRSMTIKFSDGRTVTGESVPG